MEREGVTDIVPEDGYEFFFNVGVSFPPLISPSARLSELAQSLSPACLPG